MQQFLLFNNSNISCMDPMTNKSCCICTKPTPQIQMLLASLRRIIKKKIRESADQFDVEFKNGEKNSLPRLLEIMLGDKTYSSMANSKCLHKPVFNLLKKKLRCSSETLNGLLQAQIFQLAQKNFQIDAIKKQISGAAERIHKNLLLEKQPQRAQLQRLDSEVQQRRENMRQEKHIPQVKVQEERIETIQNIPKMQQIPQQNIYYVPVYFTSQFEHYIPSFWS